MLVQPVSWTVQVLFRVFICGCFSSFSGLVGFDGRLQPPAGQKSFKLLGVELLDLVLRGRPLNAAILDPLVKQDEAITCPVKRLKPVLASAAEQKQRPAVWIQLIVFLDDTGQAIDAAAQIRFTTDQVDAAELAEINEHS